jgi:protein-L-isoaspartate(D-aspartate) O-methyltransferase
METIRKYQQQLLAQSPFLRVDNEYHNAIKEAFLKTQRHLFIDKFNDPPAVDWNIVTEENLQAHLPVLYANKPLLLYDEPDNNYQSTISQPAIVLKMLDWLELKKGHTVFEVGAGSGWDAALMGELVGEEGHIYSSEIIPKMAIHAKETIERLGISNVTILQSDGSLGYEEKAPFDRIIFTAGSYDLPSCTYHQLKDDGILLFVLKLPGGGDLLIQLKKVEGHFEAIKSAVVAFVKMAGKNPIPGFEPIRLEQLPEWPLLKDQESFRSPFWWGGSASIPLYWRMVGFRSFLGITSPAVRCFQEEDHISGTRGTCKNVWLVGETMLRNKKIVEFTYLLPTHDILPTHTAVALFGHCLSLSFIQHPIQAGLDTKRYCCQRRQHQPLTFFTACFYRFGYCR